MMDQPIRRTRVCMQPRSHLMCVIQQDLLRTSEKRRSAMMVRHDAYEWTGDADRWPMRLVCGVGLRARRRRTTVPLNLTARPDDVDNTEQELTAVSLKWTASTRSATRGGFGRQPLRAFYAQTGKIEFNATTQPIHTGTQLKVKTIRTNIGLHIPPLLRIHRNWFWCRIQLLRSQKL
jgi:hypothetical protein